MGRFVSAGASRGTSTATPASDTHPNAKQRLHVRARLPRPTHDTVRHALLVGGMTNVALAPTASGCIRTSRLPTHAPPPRLPPEELLSRNAAAAAMATTAETPTAVRRCVRHGTAVLPYLVLGAAVTASSHWELWLVYSTAFGVKQLVQAPFLAATGAVLTTATALCAAALTAFDVMSYGSRRR